jgi:hypothetical protein
MPRTLLDHHKAALVCLPNLLLSNLLCTLLPTVLFIFDPKPYNSTITTMPSPESKFRAIIVGAGPAGLAVAHCLSAAGVDFTILERRKNIVEETGASLGLWPHSVRVLDQLQLLDSARKISEPLKLSYHFGQDGKEISKAPIFDMIEQKYVILFETSRGTYRINF